MLVEFSFLRRTIVNNPNVDSGDAGRDDDYDPASDLVAIHRLVQVVIRNNDRMKAVGQQAWCERIVTALDNEVVSDDYYDHQVRKINEVYIPHIHEVTNRINWREMDAKSQSLLIQLLLRMTYYLYNSGAYKSGVELALVALCISETSNGVNHPVTASSLNSLARLYENQGKYNEAEPLYQRALAD